MVVKLLCKICFKAVANSHHAIQCDNCNIWVHVKCNKINTKTYKFLQKSSAAWYCIKCSEEIYPFLNISNEKLFETNQGKNVKFKVFTKKNSEQNIDLIDTLNKATTDQCNNYRLISLLSNISKIFEKIIHPRLSVFLSANNILYEKKFGFRNQHSTNRALIEITEKISKVVSSTVNEVIRGNFTSTKRIKSIKTLNSDFHLDVFHTCKKQKRNKKHKKKQNLKQANKLHLDDFYTRKKQQK